MTYVERNDINPDLRFSFPNFFVCKLRYAYTYDAALQLVLYSMICIILNSCFVLAFIGVPSDIVQYMFSKFKTAIYFLVYIAVYEQKLHFLQDASVLVR